MTRRTHFVLIAVLTGGTALLSVAVNFTQWRLRWPLDLAWASIPVMLLWPLVVGYSALWKPDANHERLQRACMSLLIAAYLGVTSCMLLLQEALVRTR